MSERDFPDAERIIENSALMRGFVSLIGSTATAMTTSRTAALVRSVRITHIGVVITSACVTHAVLLQFVPDRLAPVKPLAYGVVLAFAALVLVVGRITTRSSATATADSRAGTANATNS
jgi:hypothetical protein